MTRSSLRVARTALLPFAAALVTGCGTFDYSADLAENELFYADVPFRTKAPGDRQVFVAPLRDAREGTALPLHEDGYPIVYGTDEFWERPVAQMLADVLERQLGQSGLFVQLADRPAADALVLKPTLVAFTTGSKELMSGSLTFAEVGLRVEVLGPAGADGQRPVWHDHVYGNRQVSEPGIKPVSPYRLVGRALQLTMSKALAGLDGSNIGRSLVPVDVLLPTAPAEASAARR